MDLEQRTAEIQKRLEEFAELGVRLAVLHETHDQLTEQIEDPVARAHAEASDAQARLVHAMQREVNMLGQMILGLHADLLEMVGRLEQLETRAGPGSN